MAATVQPASKTTDPLATNSGPANVEQDGRLFDLLVGQEDADKARYY